MTTVTVQKPQTPEVEGQVDLALVFAPELTGKEPVALSVLQQYELDYTFMSSVLGSAIPNPEVQMHSLYASFQAHTTHEISNGTSRWARFYENHVGPTLSHYSMSEKAMAGFDPNMPGLAPRGFRWRGDQMILYVAVDGTDEVRSVVCETGYYYLNRDDAHWYSDGKESSCPQLQHPSSQGPTRALSLKTSVE
jgi:hypothetical protein